MHGASRQPPLKTRCALIWSDISPYHGARSQAASEKASLHVDTIEVLDRAGFAEFRAPVAEASPFLRHGLRLAPPLRPAPARAAIHAKLNALAPDVVFAPGWSMLEGLLAIEWCVLRNVPLVIMSESTRDDAPRSAAKELIKRRLLALAAAALVGGGPQADYATELGVPRYRIFLGYDMVDNNYFRTSVARVREQAAAMRAHHHLPEHYFLCCARLIEKKNVPRLVEAFAKYRCARRRDVWDLVVVGPGPLQAEIEAAIAAHGLTHAIHMVGAKGYADLPIYYGLASAFILPSTMDQWGLVVNEAMASGLPVLVSARCGSARDLVQEGRNGFTFDPFDVEAMADVMLRIASDGCDRAAMGAASQEIIADWGPARFAAGFEAAARAALAARPRRSSLVDRLLLRALTL